MISRIFCAVLFISATAIGQDTGGVSLLAPAGTAVGTTTDTACPHCKQWLNASSQSRDRREHLFWMSAEDRDFILCDTLPAIAEPTVIKTQNGPSGTCVTSESDSPSPDPCKAEEVGYVIFREPARFPIRGFSRQGCSDERDAAVIYEGMAIQIEPNGKYRVKFTMEAPATDATVRLQLNVWETKPVVADDGTKHDGVRKKIGTVTLPPLRYRPGRDVMKSGQSLVWQVDQSGYSPLLMCLKRENTGCENGYRITRSGSAEFGSVPVRTASY